MNAVGPDDNVRFDLLAVGKTGAGAPLAGIDADAARAKMNDGIGKLPVQQVDQIGAMHGEIRRAEFSGIGALARHARDHATVVPVAYDLIVGFIADSGNRLLQAKPAIGLHCIRRQRHAGTNLADLCRLLEHLGVDATLP